MSLLQTVLLRVCASSPLSLSFSLSLSSYISLPNVSLGDLCCVRQTQAVLPKYLTMSLIIFSVCAGVLQFGFLAYRPLMSFTFSERHDHSSAWRLLLFSIIFCQSTACFSDLKPSPHLSISCFISSPSPSFSRHPSLCCITSPFSILFPSTTSCGVITISLFPFPFFFFYLSHSCLNRLHDVGQLFPHSVFKSQTATEPHDSSRNRGRADTGGRRACDQRFAGSNLCEKCSRTNFQLLQCFSVLQ